MFILGFDKIMQIAECCTCYNMSLICLFDMKHFKIMQPLRN